MILKKIILGTLLFGFLFYDTPTVDYEINKPDKVMVLPEVLREVSGITVIDSNRLACVQDENGIIYILEATTGKILKQHAFAGDGDYEGIACVDNTMYVLRSDGTLFEIINYASSTGKVRVHNTGVPAINNEGLCYDKEGNQLLIGCKSKPGKGPKFKNAREIYAFKLSDKKISKEPLYRFNVELIKQSVSRKKITLPTRTTKKGSVPILKFTISALAIHPVTKRLYLISSTDKLLFVFDENGDPEQIFKLDPKVYNKPEGIIFFKDGKMIITNEGQDGKPTLITINPFK